MECPVCEVRMADVWGGGWYCRACQMLYGVPERRGPAPGKGLAYALLRFIFVPLAAGTVLGAPLMALAIAWPASGPPTRDFVESLWWQSLMIAATMALLALVNRGAVGRRSSLIAAVAGCAVAGVAGGYLFTDGDAAHALEMGAASVCVALIVATFASDRRRGRS